MQIPGDGFRVKAAILREQSEEHLVLHQVL
jgi:hypothetical protein